MGKEKEIPSDVIILPYKFTMGESECIRVSHVDNKWTRFEERLPERSGYYVIAEGTIPVELKYLIINDDFDLWEQIPWRDNASWMLLPTIDND